MVDHEIKSIMVFILIRSTILQLCPFSNSALVNSKFTNVFFDFAPLRHKSKKIFCSKFLKKWLLPKNVDQNTSLTKKSQNVKVCSFDRPQSSVYQASVHIS